MLGEIACVCVCVCVGADVLLCKNALKQSGLVLIAQDKLFSSRPVFEEKN